MLSFDHQNHSKWHKWCHVRYNKSVSNFRRQHRKKQMVFRVEMIITMAMMRVLVSLSWESIHSVAWRIAWQEWACTFVWWSQIAWEFNWPSSSLRMQWLLKKFVWMMVARKCVSTWILVSVDGCVQKVSADGLLIQPKGGNLQAALQSYYPTETPDKMYQINTYRSGFF